MVEFVSNQRNMGFSRRSLLGQAAAACALGAIFKVTEGPVAAQQPGRVGPGGGRGASDVHYGSINKYSAPSDLRITDMRVVTIASNFDYTIVRLDTNQGVYGLGEIRDGAPEKPYSISNIWWWARTRSISPPSSRAYGGAPVTPTWARDHSQPQGVT